MIVLDQVPISNLSEIEVFVNEISGAAYNTENGELKWKLELQPNETKSLDLDYSVKYPKSKKLYIE